MEKTLSMGAFTELDEYEMMEADGGSAVVGTIIIVLAVGGAIAGAAILGYNDPQAVANRNQAHAADANYTPKHTGVYGQFPY